MTIHELSQLYHLNREIENLQARIADLTASLEKLRHHEHSTVTGSSASFPYTPQIFKVAGAWVYAKDKAEYGQKYNTLCSLRRQLRDRCNDSLSEYERLIAYIAGIDNSLLRDIFHLRFVDGLPWGQVAASVGGNNTEDSVKKQVYRYLGMGEE